MTMEAARLYAEIGIVGMPAFEAGMTRAAAVTQASSAKIDASTMAASASVGKMTAATSAGFARAGASMELMAGPMMGFGKKMMTHVTLPIVAVGYESTKMAVEFQHSMQKIVSHVGVAQKQVDAWSKQILEMGKTVPVAPRELADALFFVTSAGFRGADAMKILKASAEGASAGLGTTKDVADAVTSAVNAYGIKNLSAARATDILFGAVKAGKMPTDALAGSLGRIMPVAAHMGVGLDEVAASIASLTRIGLDVPEATTAMRGLLMAATKPTAAATDELKKMGMSVGDLQKEIRNKGVLATLQDLTNKTHGNGTAMATLVPNVRALTGAFALTGNTMKQNAQILKDIQGNTGASDEAFKIFAQTAKYKLGVAMATVKDDMVKLGTELMPVATQAAHELAGGIEAASVWFEKLSPAGKSTALHLVEIAAVAGPALVVMGSMAKSALALGAAYQFVTGAAGKAAAAQALEGEAAMAAGAANVAAAVEIKAASGAYLLGAGSGAVAGAAVTGEGLGLGALGMGAGGVAAATAGTEAFGMGGAALGMAGAGAGAEALAAGEVAATAGAGGLMAAAAPLVGIMATLAIAAYAGKMAWDHWHESANGSSVAAHAAHVSMKDLSSSAPALASALSAEKAAAHASAEAHDKLAAATDKANRAAKDHPNQGPGGPDRKGPTAGVNDATVAAARADAAATIASANAKLAEGLNVHNLKDAYAQLAEEKLKASQLKGSGGDGAVGIKNINDAIRTQKNALVQLSDEYLKGKITAKQFGDGQAYIKGQIRDLRAEKGVDLGRIADAKAKIAELRALIKNMAGIEVAAPGVAKAMLQDMSAAERKAAFGTANINKILRAIASGKPSPNMAKGMAELATQIAASARQAAADSNASFDTMITGLGGVVGAANRASMAIANMGTHSMGPQMPHKAGGGPVSGPGTGTSDSIPAMLSDGEYVINARAAQRNLPLLDAINGGSLGGYASGGHARKGKKPLTKAERAAAAVAKGDAAWQSLQGSYALSEAKDQDVLVRAQQAHNKKGEAKAERVLAKLYGGEIGRYTKFLNHHPGKLSASTQSGIWQAITSARTNREQALATGAGATASDKFSALQETLGLKEAQDQAAFALAGMNGTDPAAAQAALTADYRNQVAQYQSFLNTPGLDQATKLAVEQAIAGSAQNATQAAQAASAPSADQAAQLAQAQSATTVAQNNAQLSDRTLAAFASSNDIGYGGGANAFQAAQGARPAGGNVTNVYALSGYDPAVQRALAASSNNGNAMGINADKMYSGRVATGV